jgi:hypothetical protein
VNLPGHGRRSAEVKEVLGFPGVSNIDARAWVKGSIV